VENAWSRLSEVDKQQFKKLMGTGIYTVHGREVKAPELYNIAYRIAKETSVAAH